MTHAAGVEAVVSAVAFSPSQITSPSPAVGCDADAVLLLNLLH